MERRFIWWSFMVFWKEIAFPFWRAIIHGQVLEQNALSLLSSIIIIMSVGVGRTFETVCFDLFVCLSAA